MENLNSGQVVDIGLPAELIISTSEIPADVRITALVLDFRADGSHREDVGTAKDLSLKTGSVKMRLTQPAPNDKQVLIIFGTRHGTEVPLSQLPRLTITVNDQNANYTWTPITSDGKVFVLLEVYYFINKYRLKVTDGRHFNGWDSFSLKTKCNFSLKEVLAITAGRRAGQSDPEYLTQELHRLEDIVIELKSEVATLNSTNASLEGAYGHLAQRIETLEQIVNKSLYSYPKRQKEIDIQTNYFIVVAQGPDQDNDDSYNAFYEAGCGDASISWRDNAFYIHFHRKAESFNKAFQTACRDVVKAGAIITGFEPDEETIEDDAFILSLANATLKVTNSKNTDFSTDCSVTSL